MKPNPLPQQTWPRPTILYLLAGLTGLLFLAWSGSRALAQEAQPTVSANQVNEVARQLWCPLCSGVRLDTCELKACEQMREVIAIKLAEGEDPESIKQYFLEQYGPQVLGEPPREGLNWLAWILPIIAVAGGGLFFWRRLHQMTRPVPSTSPSSNEESADEYTRRLDEELAQYD